MRIPKVLFFLATAVSLACTQTASQTKSQASLDRGVAATADAIHQLDRVIAQNEEDLSKLFAQQGFKFMKAAGGEELDWIKPLESGYTGFQAGKDLNAGRYAEALSEAAKIIADVWGELDPNVKLGKAGVDVAADVYEAQSLLRQQAQLLALRLDLEKQYYKLKGRSGLDLGQADKIQRALDQDAQLHQKFLESLKKYNLNQQDIVSKALRNASAGPGRDYQVASGMIVDPQTDINSLATIPGINPDFIESLRKQFELLRKGDLESVQLAGEINKYDYNTPNWSYINVFGPSRAPVDAIISKTSQPEIKIEYKPQRSGATGIVLYGPGALLFDSTNQHKVGQLYSYPQKFNSGNYVVDFAEAGFSPLPVEVRQGFLTVVTAPLAGVYLQTDNYKQTCVCLSKNNAILTTTKHWDSVKTCKGKPSTLDWPYPFWVAPGAYEVVTVDKNTSGSCTSHTRAGYSPIAVTLEDGGVVYVKTHSGSGSSTFVCHQKDYPPLEVGQSSNINKCLPDWWSSESGNH